MNAILDSLPAEEYERLQPYLKKVPLIPGQRLCCVEEPITHLWFLDSGAVSRLVQLVTGESVEAGIVGSEGAIGLPPVLGSTRSVGACSVQIDGSARIIGIADFEEHVRRTQSALLESLLRYTNLHIAVLAQLMACRCLHRIEQRLSRCILQLHDRNQNDRVRTTHDVLSEFLGVHRPSVTYALRALAATGAISLERRGIVVQNRRALQEHACECYAAIARMTAHALDGMRALRAS